MRGSRAFNVILLPFLIAARVVLAEGDGIRVANFPPYQTIGGTIQVGNWPASMSVTGTFWPTVQPVSGTFWQATQPVSIAAMPSTPVTGTFWPATQPISNANLTSLDAKSIPAAVATATVSSFSVTNGSGAITLLPSRPARIKAILFNDNNTLYIKAGSGASNADYTWRAPANTQIDVTNYTGIVTAILNTAGPGTVHVTDF